MARCKGCYASVVWRLNEGSGKRAPIDTDADPKGNIIINRDGSYRVLTKAQIAEMDKGSLFGSDPQPRYTSHFATCPKAQHFKRCNRCHKTPCVCANE